MEPRYLWLLNCSNGYPYCIRLNDDELKQYKDNYDGDFETFIISCLEDKYHFRLTDCDWMISHEREPIFIGFENETYEEDGI